MMIIGCDYHPGFQQIARLDTETGELRERRLAHREEAEAFYRDLGAQGVRVCVWGWKRVGSDVGFVTGTFPLLTDWFDLRAAPI
jgi:transposase